MSVTVVLCSEVFLNSIITNPLFVVGFVITSSEVDAYYVTLKCQHLSV